MQSHAHRTDVELVSAHRHDHDSESREQLIMRHAGLVRSIARRYHGRGLAQEDIEHRAALGQPVDDALVAASQHRDRLLADPADDAVVDAAGRILAERRDEPLEEKLARLWFDEFEGLHGLLPAGSGSNSHGPLYAESIRFRFCNGNCPGMMS